ncbi:SAV_2336 N-terminal domain-related protein [Streptomyces sp. NPDC057690]|uniref:SAV_2336 N-terminal domain-related protein n=1 Tax=Streptomyces sp. NPDC057690 TaxID=3346214 RepID=UPI0036B8ADE2
MSSGAAGAGEQDELWVARLHAALCGVGVELSPRELGDVLWLALHTPPGTGTAGAEPGTVLPHPPAPASVPQPRHRRRDGTEPPPIEVPRRVHTLTGTRDGEIPGAPVRIPGVRGLRHPLGIVRGLRALKRRVPSVHRYELDENATAEAIAESGALDAVLRPAEDRWLHLVLCVDDGPSMRVWRDTVDELAEALTGSGIFRSVLVRPLASTDPLTGERTAVLVVTDGVGDHWYTGAAREELAALARGAPTAVLHLFPIRLWSGTGLPAEPMIVRTTGPAPRNTLLVADNPWLPTWSSPRPGLPVPVLELDESSLRHWAELIASHGGVAALRVIDAAALPEARPRAGDVTAEQDTAVGRVQTFRATASPHAYELAGHLAAVDPLTLPVMRLVQAAALPDSNPVCLAEVLLSGLMHKTDALAGQDVFAFAPDVRGVLRTVINAGSANRTLDAVNDFIIPRLGRTPDFPAVIADRTGTLTLPSGGMPLAELEPLTERLRWGRLHNLPERRAVRWLPGLEDDLAWVERTLAPGARVPVVLCGPPGSDKTTVALEYAYRHLGDYELVWWVDARTAGTEGSDLAKLAEAAFWDPAADPEGVGREERTCRWLEDRAGWLLVLDQVTDDRDVARLVNRLGESRGHVLVTTRTDPATWGAATSRDLTPAFRARHDELTGLRSARTLRDQLEGLLCADPQADRTSRHRHLRVPPDHPEADGRGLAVLFCVLDGFESIIDRFGHDMGDAVLVEIARRLRDAVRGDDTVARIGDDAFVVLAGELQRTEAEALAARLRSAIIEPVRAQGRAVRVGAGFGIGWAQCGMDADRVIEAAGEAHVGQARVMETLRLADALSELACMEQRQGRLLFAELLGEQLYRQIRIRGTRRREDVNALVRAALNAPGGERLLIEVVRICEGHAAAEELEPLIAPFDESAGARSGNTEAGYAHVSVDRVLSLADALDALACLESAPGRLEFAARLGDLIDRPVEIRGVRRREDVITVVRAALNVPGGQQALVEVVRLFEGESVATGMAREITTGPVLLVPSVLSAVQEDEALAALRDAAPELSAARLGEALTRDLNGMELPAGLSPERLFAWVLQWNAQPDGLPPAVLLVERASRLVTSPVHRTALTGWVENWAADAGLSESLRRRRVRP